MSKDLTIGDVVEVYMGFYQDPWQGTIAIEHHEYRPMLAAFSTTYEVKNAAGELHGPYNSWELTKLNKADVIKCDFGCASVGATLHHYECWVRKHEEGRK